jgi:uncharacterized protein
MYHKRSIDRHLLEWKKEQGRKPLLLRGARQVGKSSAVKALATHFDHFVEVNFEENRKLATLFSNDLNPKRLVENLSIFLGEAIVPGKTLLFFDEIQACPAAISSLRFFYEKMPEMHVIAAGSLLEFALQSLPSFGVGRVRSMFVYPFSFDEFLTAMGENLLLEAKQKAGFQNPLPDIFHQKLLDLMKKFMLIGGMPEAVSKYVNSRQLADSQRVLDDLYISYKADFSKYKNSVPPTRLIEIFESVVQQTGGKFVFKKASPNVNHGQIKEALDLLIMAGLVIPVTHSAANGIPLGAEMDVKKRKMMLLDTGIFQRILGLNLAEFLFDSSQNVINKGAIAEQFWGLEYLKYGSPFSQTELFYWHRETSNSNAEIDFVVQNGAELQPIEVKSSGKGRMQSLRQFLMDKKRPFGYRFSLENFSEYENIKSMPLYAVSNFFEMIFY